MKSNTYANHTILIGGRFKNQRLLKRLAHEGQILQVCEDVNQIYGLVSDMGLPDLMMLCLESLQQLDDVKLRSLRSFPGGKQFPIILVMDALSEEQITSLLDNSMVDCVVQPESESLLYHYIRQQLELHDLRDAVRQSSDTFELALEADEIGIWDWNVVTDRAYFSPEWLGMLDYAPGDVEATGNGWRSLIYPDDLAHVERILEDVMLKDKDRFEFEHRLKTKSDGWKWILSRGKIAQRDDSGRPTRMVGTHRDIHERALMEQALQRSEERHRIISETISDYAYSYIVQPNGTLKKDWSTAAFHEITGYTFQEVDEGGWEQMIHDDDSHIAQKRAERLLSGQDDISEFRIVTKSGQVRWLRDHGHPVIDEDTGRVVHIYGAAHDITQQKRDADLLQRQNEELDAFAHTVAHDLKNPIASMMGFASLVKNYYTRMTDEQVLEHVDLIMEEGYRLKNIINSLLVLAGVSKMDEAEITVLDMHPIVDDAARRLAVSIKETNADVILPTDWPDAIGYGPWVEEVWMNYISNAIKYGGTPPRIVLGAAKEGGMVRFWVRDNGRGLTEEEQQRVFTPFTRLNQVKVEGHGLGLSVVQRITERLGGTVRVRSDLGQGSEFSFTLPAAHTKANAD